MDTSRAEAHKLLSEIIKNYATVGALIFGGIWALNKFAKLYEAEAANQNLMKVTAEANKRFARLNLSINAKAHYSSSGTFIVADVSLENLSTVPLMIRDRWGKTDSGKEKYHAPLSVYKVEFHDENLKGTDGKVTARRGQLVYQNGESVFDQRIDAPTLTIPTWSARPEGYVTAGRIAGEMLSVGEKTTIPFVVKVEDNGVYLVAYRVKIPIEAEDVKEFEKYWISKLDTEMIKGKERKYIKYTERRYVIVDRI